MSVAMAVAMVLILTAVLIGNMVMLTNFTNKRSREDIADKLRESAQVERAIVEVIESLHGQGEESFSAEKIKEATGVEYVGEIAGGTLQIRHKGHEVEIKGIEIEQGKFNLERIEIERYGKEK